MATGIWDTLGSAVSGGVDLLGGLLGGAVQGAVSNPQGTLSLLQGLGLVDSPTTPQGPFAGLGLGGLGSLGSGLLGGFDLPGVDITAQGTAGLTQPFSVSPTGRQTAKPFVAVRANGSPEWFIPAGKPKTWSKASIKKQSRCGHTHRHYHRRRRPR